MKNENQKEQSDKLRKRLLLFAIITIIIVPCLTQILINFDTTAKGSDDGWLGFWGGYLGSIIGVVGTILVFQMQLSNETKAREEEQKANNERRKEDLERAKELRLEDLKNATKIMHNEKVDNTFFNLLNLLSSQRDKLIDTDIFNIIYESIGKNLYMTLSKEGMEYFYERKDTILTILNSMISDYVQYIKSKKTSHMDVISRQYHSIRQFSYMIKEETISDLVKSDDNMDDNIIDCLQDMVAFSEDINIIPKKTRDSLLDFQTDLQKYTNININELPSNSRKDAIENAVSESYSEIGGFLRLLHRIVKFINENVEDDSIKKDYIGFLRATLDETEILVIYYNSIYSDKGFDLKEQLVETTFFGDPEDFNKPDAPPFVTRDKLYFEDDFKIMSNLKEAPTFK